MLWLWSEQLSASPAASLWPNTSMLVKASRRRLLIMFDRAVLTVNEQKTGRGESEGERGKSNRTYCSTAVVSCCVVLWFLPRTGCVSSLSHTNLITPLHQHSLILELSLSSWSFTTFRPSPNQDLISDPVAMVFWDLMHSTQHVINVTLQPLANECDSKWNDVSGNLCARCEPLGWYNVMKWNQQ